MRHDPKVVARSPHEAFFTYFRGGQLQAVRDRRWKLHFPHDYRTLEGRPGAGDVEGAAEAAADAVLEGAVEEAPRGRALSARDAGPAVAPVAVAVRPAPVRIAVTAVSSYSRPPAARKALRRASARRRLST